MEIIKINCEKVKISLSHDDMEHLQINCDMLDGVDARGRQAFNKILEEAKDKCGFATYGKRIFVQLFPSKDGGCEMFVTKLSDTAEKRYAVSKRRKNICYLFHDINYLLRFCNVVKESNYSGYSSLYIDEGRRTYYICLERDFPFAAEFYGKKCVANTDAYIKEHYKLVTDNAVEILGKL